MEPPSKRRKHESPRKRRKDEPPPHFPPLVSVRVVCRKASILGIAHVVAALDAFLDCSPRCTVTKACALCSPRLLHRVLAHDARESRGSVKRDPRFRQWQFERGMTTAVAWGSLELVKALGTYFRRCNVPSQVTADAASRGKVGILNWLYTHRQDVLRFGCDADHALVGNHFEVAKWLRCKLSPSDRMKVSWAAIAAWKGRLDMVKWAYGKITGTLKVASISVVAAAVDGGHLDILMWLFEKICGDRPCFSVSLSRAVSCGHLNVIEWMLRNQRAVCGPPDSLAVAEAARNGRLGILRLLHAYKIDGDPSKTMDFAAGDGHLDTIKWLHVNNDSGCTRSAMDSASKNGFLDGVRWLHENRSEGCSRDAMDWAAGDGHMEVLQWLAANRTEGCSSRATDWAAGHGHMEVLQWLAANRTEGCSSRAMNDSAGNGHLDIVKWLHINRIEGCTVDAMDQAAKNGHLEVVEWLHANRPEGRTSCAMHCVIWSGKINVALSLHREREKYLVNAVRSGDLSTGQRLILLCKSQTVIELRPNTSCC
ncbi:hypothetical protein BBJ28_00020359 [Nothophytophthora sp. Chile5]|nr:hypothetical protein BBJ28_00020359 [Nothophytophthora sp. Chile5]